MSQHSPDPRADLTFFWFALCCRGASCGSAVQYALISLALSVGSVRPAVPFKMLLPAGLAALQPNHILCPSPSAISISPLRQPCQNPRGQPLFTQPQHVHCCWRWRHWIGFPGVTGMKLDLVWVHASLAWPQVATFRNPWQVPSTHILAPW